MTTPTQQHIHFVTALLKSIWPNEKVPVCLGVDSQAYWKGSFKKDILRIHTLLRGNAKVYDEDKQMRSPCAMIWNSDLSKRIAKHAYISIDHMPSGPLDHKPFLFPFGPAAHSRGDILQALRKRLESMPRELPAGLTDLRGIQAALLSLVQYYTTACPAGGDISLYDFARLTAALLACGSVRTREQTACSSK
jgi:hypothetical protein